MKKIGVLTWHYHHNYGGVLQAFAMQCVFEKLNYNVDIVNYRPEKYGLKECVKRLLLSNAISSRLLNKCRDYKFNKFLKQNLKQSKTFNVSTIKKLKQNKYDAFFVGSDQIWSPNVLDTTYLLDFVDDNNKKFSYAPSSVIETKDKDKIKLYKKYLSKFNKISVREQKSKENIDSYVGCDCKVVLDPTLLLDEPDYTEVVSERNVPSGDYVLCYFLGNNDCYRDVIDQIKGDMTVYSIMSSNDSCGHYNKIYDVGPKEFLGLIKNCKLMVTDSFHGLAFSIIFKKQFYVLERFKKDSEINQNPRIDHILNLLDLHERKVVNVINLSNLKTIQYDEVYQYLNIEREKSISYLIDCLDD